MLASVHKAVRADLTAAAIMHLEPRLPMLARLQNLCDNWIEQYAERFDLFVWQTLAERYRHRKAFAEAALYLYVAHPFGDDEHALSKLHQLVTARVNDL